LKKTIAILALSIFLLVASIPFSLSVKPASAQGAGYTIQNVDHQVEIMYSGNVVIRDTIKISGQVTDGFLIGFPYQYSSYILEGEAFNSEKIFPMNLGVQLGDRSGFYGAEVTFPEGAPQVFTVVFIMSNSLLTSNQNGFYLDFPAYPSFAVDASRCNVTIVLPTEASVISVAKADGDTATGKYVKDNLAAFAYVPGNATIYVPQGWIRQINVAELNRVVNIGGAGDVTLSDSYHIINNSTAPITSLKLDVPLAASNVVARDEVGTPFTLATLSQASSALVSSVNVTLTGPLQGGHSVSIDVDYTLPGVTADQGHFDLNVELFPPFSYYVDHASITVVPPEGAHIITPQLSSAVPSLTLSRELIQETMRVDKQGVSYVDRDIPSEKAVGISYDYNPLWLSLRPTFWVWGLAAVGSVAIVFMRRRPKSAKTAKPQRIAVPKLTGGRLSSDQVKAFVEAYEEKNRLSSEIKLLISRAQKGRIPRRQYKVQRRALELRSSSLSKSIADLKVVFRSTGGNYADLVKQLDAAESELNKADGSIRNAEARQRTGELPLEEYKKSIPDLQKRKEKAESTISGILLRLREEIR